MHKSSLEEIIELNDVALADKASAEDSMKSNVCAQFLAVEAYVRRGREQSMHLKKG